jgi:hypothetical protein
MKKAKLSMKEIDALSSVISSKINKARAVEIEQRLKKDKEYLKLLKDVEIFNKEIVKFIEMEAKFRERIDSIEKKSDLKYSSSDSIGYLSTEKVFNCFNYREYKIIPTTNILFNSEIKDKLVLKNIDGELKVDDFIDEIVKEFI